MLHACGLLVNQVLMLVANNPIETVCLHWRSEGVLPGFIEEHVCRRCQNASEYSLLTGCFDGRL